VHTPKVQKFRLLHENENIIGSEKFALERTTNDHFLLRAAASCFFPYKVRGILYIHESRFYVSSKRRVVYWNRLSELYPYRRRQAGSHSYDPRFSGEIEMYM